MPVVLRSGRFDAWAGAARRSGWPGKIQVRIDRLAAGNPGDHKSVGQGIMELRIAFGPGYRVYYKRRGSVVILLLAGGDKSTQSDDIAIAKLIAAEWE